MNSSLTALVGLASASIIASPASATKFNIDLLGTLVQTNSPNPVAGLPFGTGSQFVGHWLIDFGPSTPIDIAAIGGTGQARLFSGAVTHGVIVVGGAVLTQGPASLGNVLAINDGRILRPGLPALRLDQVGITDGVRFTPDFTLGYQAQSGLAPNVFLRSLSFGRSSVTVDPVTPGLISGVGQPDFFGLLNAGQPLFFGVTFAMGSPTNPTQIASLPTSNFALTNMLVFLTAVPEPGSWALLIAGFGLTGAMVRRRRALTA